MLDEGYILRKMGPYLYPNRELSEFEFSFLFSKLQKPEQYEVIKIMIAHDIEYVDEKTEETQEVDKSPILRSAGNEAPETLMALTNEELCVLYQKGNPTALAVLIEKNKLFVMKYVIKVMKSFRHQCLTEDDLFQEGVFGVMTTADKFDPSLSLSFLTCCGNWIWQSITRAIVNSGFLIRLPDHVFAKVVKVARFRRENPLATEEQLLEILKQSGWELSGVSLRQYIFYSECYLNTTSLNAPVGEEDDTEFLHFIPDDARLPPL